MGRLNHHIVLASDLTSYLKHVEEVIQEEYPQYELAIQEINKYYDINFVSFVAYDSTLFVHVPIYLKLKEQPILDLFRTESYAIPHDPADLVSNEYGEWIGSYTKIEFEKKYMAIGEEIFLSFNQEDLDNCKRIGGLFYCENMLLLKHISEHTCASAIYMNKWI